MGGSVHLFEPQYLSPDFNGDEFLGVRLANWRENLEHRDFQPSRTPFVRLGAKNVFRSSRLGGVFSVFAACGVRRVQHGTGARSHVLVFIQSHDVHHMASHFRSQIPLVFGGRVFTRFGDSHPQRRLVIADSLRDVAGSPVVSEIRTALAVAGRQFGLDRRHSVVDFVDQSHGIARESEWHVGRLNHFAVGWKWIEKQLQPPLPVESSPQIPIESTNTPQANPDPAPAILPAHEDPAATEAADPIVVSSPLPKKPIVSAKFYFKELASSLEQINLGLLVFGLCWLWRGLLDWDRGALFLIGFAFAGAVWILYEQSGVLNGRYFFPIYLALMPYFATGLLLVWNALWAGAVRLNWAWLKPRYTAIFIFWLAIGLGWIDALTTFHTEREQEVDLGEWLTETHGPFQFVATDPTGSRAGFHAYRQVPGRLQNWATMEIQFPEKPYDLLILTCRCTPPECRTMVHDAATRMGLKQLAIPKDIPASGLFLIYLREPPPKVASDPNPHSGTVSQ